MRAGPGAWQEDDALHKTLQAWWDSLEVTIRETAALLQPDWLAGKLALPNPCLGT